MKCPLCIVIVGAAVVSASIAVAQSSRENPKPSAANPQAQTMPEMPPPPPGWTAEEWGACMQACMEAGTPGENHALLAKSVGVWKGKTTTWMGPGAPPTDGECTTVITSILDGRFTKADITSTCDAMPGMIFNGIGTYGYDNVTNAFQCTWLDNMSTTTMVGSGQLSSDKKTMTWVYKYTCPYTKKPMTMRQVEQHVNDNEVKIEFYMPDVKSGEEYKMMEIASKRTPATTATGAAR